MAILRFSPWKIRNSVERELGTLTVVKLVAFRPIIACSALQESSTPTVSAVTKETVEATTAEAVTPAKPKPPPKAPVKPLARMMEEDVIPSLKATLEAQDDIFELELSFQDNRQLEGSFLKKGIRYSFWAFFPNGVLTGKSCF
ncbi:hypothetical protein Acr_15g0004100 [Actinidia rufa]|uniref:Uncharacterized protein n=1 Tax=Actinidia rufa TaxID=165716 RepID=A0A7J0FSZ2_9ERIC|nr:hypothetical protein Acr_15g0004100 [Actinidia rufa]